MSAALALKTPHDDVQPGAVVWACLDDLGPADVLRAAAQPYGGAPLITAGGIGAAFERLQHGASPRILVVGIQNAPDPVSGIRALAEKCGSLTRIIALGTVNDVALYRALRGAGAAEYVVLPTAADALGAAFDDAARNPPAATDDRESGTCTIAVTGALGGAGASTLAINAAWHLAAECGRRVALIDLDAQFGRAALSLDLDPSHGMREIFEHPERIDSLFIAGALVPARAGLWVLGGEEPLDTRVEVTAGAVDRLLDEITSTGEAIDTVILDVPRTVAAAAPDTLRRARAVAIVSELSLAGIRDTGRLCGRIAEACDDDAIRIIAGKVAERNRSEIDAAEFERGTGRRITGTLPWDLKNLSRAGREGKALAEIAASAPLARSIARLAEEVAGVQPTPSGPARLLDMVKHAIGKG
jgi:pilus assembly protein CpaE